MDNILIPTNIANANEIRAWFQENGSLPFEHGYQGCKISVKGTEYKLYMCSVDGVHLQNPKTRELKKISWLMLPTQTIKKVIKDCNRYYDYVMNNA